MKRTDSKYGSVFFSRCIQRYLFLVFSMLLSDYASSQSNILTDSTGIVADSLTNDTIYSFAEVMPEYPGGDPALLAFFRNTIEWPNEIDWNDPPPTNYMLSWVVEKDGTISQPEVETSAPMSEELKQQFIEAITALPRFQPGTINNIPVRVKFKCRLHMDFQD